MDHGIRFGSRNLHDSLISVGFFLMGARPGSSFGGACGWSVDFYPTLVDFYSSSVDYKST
jgi:hypothetical protein